jgi:hypothetical protein
MIFNTIFIVYITGWLTLCLGLDTGITQYQSWDSTSWGDSLTVMDLGTSLNPVSISCGSSAACVILEDSTVRCWGDYRAQSGWCNVGYSYYGGAATAINLGGNGTASKIQLKYSKSCAQVNSTCVKCWGTSNHLFQGNGPDSGCVSEMGDNLQCLYVPPVNMDEILDFCIGGTCIHSSL